MAVDNRSRNFATVIYPDSASENWIQMNLYLQPIGWRVVEYIEYTTQFSVELRLTSNHL